MNKTRIRDYGIQMGTFPCGPRNAITDVAGVTVGYCTIDTPDSKTGVTVILPSQENIFQKKLIASSYVLNGFGKSTGLLQINELGSLESPIALTNTLNVGLVQEGLVDYMVSRCEQEQVPIHSFNPVVGECNDCHLNNIKKRAVKPSHVLQAIETASQDFSQGDVGAGKGTICFGFKGGIGSSSRKLKIGDTWYTVGILVQSNFGRTRDLEINGFPLGEKVYKEIEAASQDKGSIMSVLATDLPLSSRQLHRILKRLGIGLGRTGSRVGHGSGDVMLGFSTANVLESDSDFQTCSFLNESNMDLAFRAAIESEEEAVLNSMVAADTVKGYTGETRYGLRPYLERYIQEII